MNFTKYNTSTDTALKFDAGLRAYMLNVYNYMTLALAITGFAAYFATQEAFLSLMFANGTISPLGWIIQLAPIGIVFFLSFKINSMSAKTAKTVFFIYAIVMGLSMGPFLARYTGESVARAFFVTASVFGSMSIYGYTTKRDLTSFGSFLLMGVFGLMIASLFNIFLHSSSLDFVISILGVLIFTGLTAYDTQKIKEIYAYSFSMNSDSATKLSIHAALTLYIDFINIFIMLLRFFGDRRND